MQLEKGEPHRARGMPVFDEHVDATSECSVEQHVVDEVTDIDSRDDEGEPEVENEDTRHLTTPVPKGILSETRSCLLYTSPSPRDATLSRMPSSA